MGNGDGGVPVSDAGGLDCEEVNPLARRRGRIRRGGRIASACGGVVGAASRAKEYWGFAARVVVFQPWVISHE